MLFGDSDPRSCYKVLIFLTGSGPHLHEVRDEPEQDLDRGYGLGPDPGGCDAAAAVTARRSDSSHHGVEFLL